MQSFKYEIIVTTLVIIGVVFLLLIITGCAVRVYGNMKCEGKCELTIDREVGELQPIPKAPLERVIGK